MTDSEILDKISEIVPNLNDVIAYGALGQLHAYREVALKVKELLEERDEEA